MSDPYFAIASAYGRRGYGVTMDSSFAAKIACISRSTMPKMRSGVANDTSRSIWVNSGCRSARRSSSRKQWAICEYRSIPLIIRICLKICGDCGKAKNSPGCTRLGTR